MDEPIVDENTIDLSSGVESDSITIDTMESYQFSYNTIPSSITISNANSGSNYGAIGSSGSFLTSNGFNGTSWSNINWAGSTSQSAMTVSGDAEFEGDVKIKGVSIAKTLEAINNRLAILQPDPAKLEHFAALKKAYEHYKTLEALCEIPKKENEE
jgi:hypothetical protein